MEKYKVLGCPCLNVENEKQMKDYILDLIQRKKGGYSVAINAEKIMLFNKSNDLKELINDSILQTPDGAGAAFGFKILYGKKIIKVDLPKIILEICNENHLKLFILGAKEAVNKIAISKIQERYSKIKIMGRLNGFFKDEDIVIEKLQQLKPDVVLVALGSPRQERLGKNIHKSMPGILFIGCGGALDILAGKTKRAPGYLRDNNLEWFYRFLKAPITRINRQNLFPLFILKLLAEYFRKSNYSD